MKQFWMAIFFSGAALGTEVVDNMRACPVGFFYSGEVEHTAEVTRGQHWIMGDTSPVYSCYRVVSGSFDWVQANIKCMEVDGQLLSVNNHYEDSILTGDLFTKKAFFNQTTQEMELPTGPVITSGVSLSPSDWTWFGAGESMDSNKTGVMNGLTGNTTTNDNTLCVSVQWTAGENLQYSVKSCVDQYTMALCEVRAYTQTWYVWFSINWIQVLFLFTLVLLIVSSCVTMHIWVKRPTQRPTQGRIPRPSPYTPQDIPATHTTPTSNANKYAEKGKEILGKIIFYRKPEDKQKLTEDA